MRNRSIQTKLLFSFGVLVAAFLFLSTVIVSSTMRTRTAVLRSADQLFPAALQAQHAENAFSRAVKHFQEAVVLQDAGSLQAGDAELADTLATQASLARFTFALNSGRASLRTTQLQDLDSQVQAFRRRASDVYPIIVRNPDQATPQVLSQVADLARASQQIAAQLKTLRLDSAEDVTLQLQDMNLWSTRERLFSIIILLFALLWVGVSSVLLKRQIVTPIRILTNRLRDIAEGDGDLTRRLQVESRDELGQVANSFNLFVDHLHQILTQVAAGTIQLTSSTASISTAANELAQRSAHSQRESQEIATAMEDMAASVAEVSRTSHSAAESARNAVATAREGDSAVRRAVSTMRNVSASVEQAAKQIVELGTHASEIGNITVVIHTIAEQTNLLALNAAIEAAHAGEHGRGFNVVASEVRGLAERTAAATTQIADTIRILQSLSAAAVETMRHSTQQVQLGVEAAASTGSSLERIIDASTRGEQIITGVAVAATQQATGTRQVNENAGRIALLTSQSAAGAQTSATASAELSTLALKLQHLIARFHLQPACP